MYTKKKKNSEKNPQKIKTKTKPQGTPGNIST